MFTYVASPDGTVHEFNCEVAPSERKEETVVQFATMNPDAIYFQSEEVIECPEFNREHLICCDRSHYNLFHNSATSIYNGTEY